MSTYPSAATLAAFRRSIRPDWYARTFSPDRTGENGYAWPMAPLDASPNAVARKYGIGDAARGPEGHLTVKARRGASALRTRAYLSMVGTVGASGIDWRPMVGPRDMVADHEAFVPYGTVCPSCGFDNRPDGPGCGCYGDSPTA